MSPVPGTPPEGVRARLLYYWLPLAAVLVLDQASKWVVAQGLSPMQNVPLLGTVLQLTYVRNPGAAFSLLAHPSAAAWRLAFLVGVAAVASVVLTVIAHREAPRPERLVPLGLVAGGALGNLIDRVTAGTVVDFIEFSWRAFHFPVFNLADSAVCLGVGWILWLSFFDRPPEAGRA